MVDDKGCRQSFRSTKSIMLFDVGRFNPEWELFMTAQSSNGSLSPHDSAASKKVIANLPAVTSGPIGFKHNSDDAVLPETFDVCLINLRI